VSAGQRVRTGLVMVALRRGMGVRREGKVVRGLCTWRARTTMFTAIMTMGCLVMSEDEGEGFLIGAGSSSWRKMDEMCCLNSIEMFEHVVLHPQIHPPYYCNTYISFMNAIKCSNKLQKACPPRSHRSTPLLVSRFRNLKQKNHIITSYLLLILFLLLNCNYE